MQICKFFLLLFGIIFINCLVTVAFTADAPAKTLLPRLLDLGSVECIPCKKMAPILEELKTQYTDKFTVEFIDVWKDPDAGDKYGISLIPTQIFFDAQGKELFRHEGFFSKEDILAKWQEFGVNLAGAADTAFNRWAPAKTDTRDKATICYMCDGDISSKTKVTVKTEKGDVNLSSMHHYFVMLSCLTTDSLPTETNATVADWVNGTMVPVQSAVYLYSFAEQTGRPEIKAFANRELAMTERAATGGSLLDYVTLRNKELTAHCGFCDRAVYPEDAALVKANGVYTWGCCSHCALGVAARLGTDIEVHEKDRLTGEPVIVKTLNGSVASLEPATAVAWYGQRTKPDGTYASAGCFHQGFFTSLENLQKWVAANPLETGEMITIEKALKDKMALSAQQIQKACKIGECAPK